MEPKIYCYVHNIEPLVPTSQIDPVHNPPSVSRIRLLHPQLPDTYSLECFQRHDIDLPSSDLEGRLGAGDYDHERASELKRRFQPRRLISDTGHACALEEISTPTIQHVICCLFNDALSNTGHTTSKDEEDQRMKN